LIQKINGNGALPASDEVWFTAFLSRSFSLAFHIKREERVSTKRKQTSKLITFGGIGVIGALIALMIFLQVEASRNNDFRRAFEAIVIDTNELTSEYIAEEEMWLSRDNNTLIQVIDQYMPRYEQLLDRARSMDTPDRYELVHEHLVNAIELEKQSYEHFRNYLVTEDVSEYERSSEMLSRSLAESANADAAIKEAG
jgi:hypothetical protein